MSPINFEHEINSEPPVLLREPFFQAGLASPLFAQIFKNSKHRSLHLSLHIYILLNQAQFVYLAGFL